jgi:chromosome segregation ATPase
MDSDQDTSWLDLDTAGQRLGLSRDALRKRIARGKLEARKGNDGTMRVLVTSAMLSGQEADTSGTVQDSAEVVRLLVQLEEAEERADHLGLELEEARKDAGRWRDSAAQAGERAARAEGERDALQSQVADLKATLEHEKAERRDAIAELIVARKGWLERLLEVLRRR